MNMIKNLFSDKKFYRTLIILAVPIIIQNLLVSSLNMVDTMMIGAVGENEIAAVGISNQYFLIYQMLLGGIAGGCTVFISQFWGAGNKENIKRILGVGLVSILFFGTVITLFSLWKPEWIVGLYSKDPVVIKLGVDYLRMVSLSYIITGITFLFSNALRCVGHAKIPMFISFLAILVNVFFNYMFIFGKFGAPVMGVTGAALGTVIARLFEVIVIMGYSFRKSMVFYGKIKEYFEFKLATWKTVYSSILPIALNELCWGLGFTLYTMAYGIIGTQAIAAVQISNTIQNLFMVFCFGMASASMVMIGNTIGSNKKEEAKAHSRKFAFISVIIGIMLSITVFVSASWILTFFQVTDAVKQITFDLLLIFAISAPIRCLNIVLIVGVFRGGGDAGFALKAEAITMWCIGVPLAFIGASLLNLTTQQVAVIITLEEVIKFVVCVIRLKGNKWINDVTGSFVH